MKVDSYYWKVVYICVALFIVALVLSFTLYNSGPRVRLTSIDENIKQNSLTVNSVITLAFDRPIQQKDYTDYITIEPGLDFKTTTGTQEIRLTLLDNVEQATRYTIDLQPEVYDQSGRKMKEQYSHVFETAILNFAYIERNYDTSVEELDYVKVARVGSVPEVVFSHPQILNFAANNEFIVISVKEQSQDRLFVLDRSLDKTTEIDIPLKGRVNSLALAENGRTALFTTVPDFNELVSELEANQSADITTFKIQSDPDSSVRELSERYTNRVEAVNLTNGKTWVLVDESNEFVTANNIQLDTSGQVALVQDDMQIYYAVSPFNDYSPLIIGTYNQSFGFDQTGREITLRNNEGFLLYDTVSGDTSPLSIESTGFIGKVSTKSSQTFLSSTSFSDGSLRSKVSIEGSLGGETETVWRSSVDDDSTLLDFTESYDSSFVALEKDPGDCEYDSLGQNNRCKEATIELVNTSSSETIDSFRGIDLIWLP